MAEPAIEVMRSRDCQRTFLAMMWAFLFLLPLPAVKVAPSASLSILPDAVGWLIFVIAFGMARNLHPAVRTLRRLALVGLIVCLPRVLRFHQGEAPWQQIYGLLQAGGAAVALVFAWRLCRMVGDMATAADRPALKANADVRFWLYAAGVLLPFGGAFVPQLSLIVFGESNGLFIVGSLAAIFVYIAITISLMMGLMASTARMCVRLEREHQQAADEDAAHRQGSPPA